MATIYPRGPRWWISWRAGGRSHARSLGAEVRTRADAAAAKRELERELAKGALLIPGTPTLGSVIEDFVRAKERKKSPATAIYYRKHAGHFRRLLPIGRAIGEIRPAVIDGYLRRRAEEASPATANKERTTLAVLWKWAMRQGLAATSPVLATEPYPVDPVERAPCPRAMYIAFLLDLRTEIRTSGRWNERHIRRLYADAIRALWWTGLRLGELCRLTPADVDVDHAAIRVRSAPNKGGARWLSLPARLRPLFRRRISRGAATVWSTSEGRPAYNALMLFWRRWLEARPEYAGLSSHAFRHAYASRAEAAGVDPVLRSRGLLGHATIQMTAHYSHREVEQLRAAQAAIEAHERRGLPRVP